MSTTIPITALLLPPSPSTSIQSSVSFWTPTITSAYARLRGPSLLYIGVTPPFSTTSRRASFAAAEKLLTALYALIYGLSATHDAADVDVRIVFLSEEDAVFGPVMSVEQLADLQEWDQLLCPRNDVGYLLQGQFLASTSSPGVRVYYVDAPTKAEDGEGEESVIREVNGEEHTVVAVGGTFDHLHLGHKLLLTCTAYMASTATASTRLIVGLSGPAMLKDKEHAEYMETWEMRASRTLEFLRGIVDLTPYDCRAPLATTSVDGGLVATFTEWREEEAGAAAAPPRTLTVFVSELSDPFGPTITDESITAIVVTKETESGGAAVNRRREEKGWAPLEVGVVDLLMDGEKKLSSSELRRRAGQQKGAGEVNSAA